MIAGLGTGSTVRFLVDELGRRVQEEGLDFTGVTTSRRTQEQPNGITSTGSGNLPMTSTTLDSSTIHTILLELTATIFSHRRAAPPPLMPLKLASTSSAPSIVRSIDLHLERIDDPQALAEDLINIVGVVEHGLFLNMVNEVRP